MDPRRESQLLELALERGLITREDVQAVETSAPADPSPDPLEKVWGGRLAELIRSGRLDRRRLLRLLDELKVTDETLVDVPWQAGKREVDRKAPAPEPVARRVDWAEETAPGGEDPVSTDLDFLADWERYRLVSFLGAGGMGRVYKAFDPSLGRFAALKFLRWNDPLQLERFLREARSQARVDHDNVCKVYEAGKVRGQPYIAMQYIDGETLGSAGDLLTLEQKVQVIRDVALAIHAAHRMGLIHRDLKPGNILLERQEDGRWRPFVVDFGLAQDQEALGLTRTGSVTGTPAYLSPEQAQGQPIDRRSDVYSLGVVLYELLAGDVPLRAGSLAESLIKVVSESPVPLRRAEPKLPRDLETIVMKCLEKEPQRRYESARALAEDLDRFLDGEPIQARRASLAYRTAKWVRRNRALAGVLAGATLLLLAVAAWSLHLQWRAEQRAQLLQRFSQEVAQVELEMRLVSLLPRHDITPNKERLRRRMARIAEEMERLGSVAAGPGHYALGRGSLALHDYERALEHLEEAWRLGERRPEVASGLGRALGALYQKALLVVSESPGAVGEEGGPGGEGPSPGGGSWAEIERRYLKPALTYLRQGGEADNPYVQAMIALYDRRYDEARSKARQAYRETPWFYEAKQLEGEVFIEQGERARLQGRYEEALSSYRQAGEVYAQLLTTARSDATLYAAECGRRLQVLLVRAEIGSFDGGEVARTLEPCDLALEIDPEVAEAYTQKAHLRWRWGQQLVKQGEDPRPTLREAARLARRALELNPREVLAYHHLATANRELASWALAHGEDPHPFLEVAITSLEQSLEIQPRQPSNLNGLGNAYLIRSQAEMASGADPLPSIDRAIDAYRRAMEIEPLAASFLSNLGWAALAKAEYQVAQGEDPTAAIQEAVDVLEQALELNPRQASAHNNLGIAHLSLGDFHLREGENAGPALDRAIACFRQARKLRPKDAKYLFNIGVSERYKAASALARGEDPGPALVAARRAYAEALRLAPQADLYLEQARLERLAFRRARLRGEDPSAFAEAAARALELGFRENPNFADLHQEEAALQRARAEWLLERGESPSGAVRQGLAAAEAALERNPALSESRALQGALYLLASRAAGEAGDEPRELARRAVETLEAALEGQPHLQREYGELLARARARAAGSG